MTLNEVWIPSPHYSSSRGPYNKAVFHTTEGAMKIRDLGAWFQNPSAQCSSHHGADNYERGVFGAYVYENHKAWTQGNANPYCLSIELCAYASWSRNTWLDQKGILVDNAAEWLRHIVDKYGIPWTVLSNSQAQDPNIRGICQHKNFGSWGSGHHDCGDGFPMDVVVDKAKKWAGSKPPSPVEEDIPMVAVAWWGNKLYMAGVAVDGKVKFWDSGTWSNVDQSQSGAKVGSASLTVGATGDRTKFVIGYVNGAGAACTYECEQDADGRNPFRWSSKSNAGVFG